MLIKKYDVLVVLSGGITQYSKLPFFVKTRLDRAYHFLHNHQAKRVIVSGKWTYLLGRKQKVTEADAMANYLIKLGVPSKVIEKEQDSQDLISSIYYLKKTFVERRKIRSILLITSDFQKERVEFIWRKIMGEEIDVQFEYVHSHLTAPILWEFFTYEKQMLLETKAFLRRMRKGDASYLTHRLFNNKLYRLQRLGKTRLLVYNRLIGKKSSLKRHYSLQNIYKKKQEIFDRFHLTESTFHKGSKVDFWPERVLNFVGRDKNNTLYILKFVLKPKDNAKLKQEIHVARVLKKNKVSFVPEIVGYDIDSPPIWYLYKAVN